MMIYDDNVVEYDFSEHMRGFSGGAMIFAKEVHDPERYGVVEFDGDKVVSIEEKPENPKSNHAIIGVHMFENAVFDFARSVGESSRGEIELTDVINEYLHKDDLSVKIIDGMWEDVGTYESLLRASNYFASKTSYYIY